MGTAQQLDIHGAKGGSDKPKTPTEAPDSLRSVAVAKILIAIGEGEFAGKPIPAGQFAQVQKAADLVMSGAEPDPTGGATHYYATTMPKAPGWAARAKQTLKLGHHIFFKDVP